MNTHAYNLLRKLFNSIILLVFFFSGLGLPPVVHAQTLASPGSSPNTIAPAVQVANSILLVDDDNNDPDVRPSYTAALIALGYTEASTAQTKKYVIWDTNGTDSEPTGSTLANFAIVIWFTGAEGDGSAGPGTAGSNALGSWLGTNPGGCFFLSSQDYYSDKGITAFGSTYLGIDSVAESVGQTSVTGTGMVFGGLGPYTISYPRENYSDSITPTISAEPAFTGDHSPSFTYAAIQKHVDAYRTVYLGFPFEGLPTAQDRQTVLGTFVAWCTRANQTLTINKTGNGSGTITSDPAGVNCGGAANVTCNYDFAYNTTLALTAHTTSPYIFAGWSGACTGSGTCSVKMSMAKSVTATFVLPTNTIYVMDVFTTDGSGLEPALLPQYSIMGDLQAAAAQTFFSPGDPIRLVMQVKNQVDNTQCAYFDWIVLDSDGYDVLQFEQHTNMCNIPKPPDTGGITYPYLPTTVPYDLPPGAYTFYGYITYHKGQPNEFISYDSTIFYIGVEPHRIFLPMIRR